MRAAIELVERLGGVVAGRRGHPRVHPWVQWDHHSHRLWWPVLSPPVCVSPQVWLPSAWRTAREESGSRSATSAPTVSPPACSPASTSTSLAGTDVELAPVCPLQPPEGHRAAGSAGQGCSSVEEGTRPQWQPSILLLAYEPGGCTQGQGDPQPAPAPHPQPHAFLTKHKKGFIKTKGSLRASSPASSTCVCIATGATWVLLPAPARGAQAGKGLGGAGGWQGRLLGAGRGRPSLVRRCEHGGGWGCPLTGSTWVSCGALTGTGRSPCC